MVSRVGEFSEVLPPAQPAPWWIDQVTVAALGDLDMVDRLVDLASEDLKRAWTAAKAESSIGLKAWLLRAIPHGAKGCTPG
eukprot:7665973-Pyramimonas_sp.AAC.1